MAELVLLPAADEIESGARYSTMAPDGTGGMLTVAEETLQQIAKEHGTEVATHLHSQEISAETYVICKAYCSMGKATRRTTSSVDPSILTSPTTRFRRTSSISCSPIHSMLRVGRAIGSAREARAT